MEDDLIFLKRKMTSIFLKMKDDLKKRNATEII
jgi:hypothetical protein